MSGGRAALVGLALLAGCASGPDPDSFESRLIELERKLASVQRQLGAQAGLEARLEVLEAALEAPAPLEPLLDRVLLLEAEVQRLNAAARTPAEGSATASPDEAPALIRPPGAVAPPPTSEFVQPLSLASGGLLMLQTEAGLVRLRLRGIEVPQEARTYADEPVLRERHAQAFGAQAVAGDDAYRASRDQLAALLSGVRLRLEYGDEPPSSDAVLDAYLIAERGPQETFDVGAAMIRLGYAVAREGHPREARYRGLEEGARGAKRGLFAGAGE